MLKKLFKYDFKSVWGLWWIVALALPGVSIVGASAFRIGMATVESMPFIGIICFFAFGISIIAVLASFVVTMLLVYQRFYKNLYTDEGYLTFTLPVSRRDILFSKTLNSMIWQFFHFLLLIGCIFIYLLIAPPTESGILNLAPIGEALSFVGEALGKAGAWLIAYIPLAILMLLASLFWSVVLIELCITFGSILATKHKIVMSVLMYYVISMVISFVGQILVTALALFFIPGITSYVSGGGATLGHTVIILLALIVIASWTAISLLLYYFMLGRIERNLNLA